jgi:hypothetical protein
VGLESAIDALIKCIREHKDDSSKDLLARFEKILKFDSSIAESKIFLALDPVGQTHFAEVIKQLAAEIAKNRFRKLNETHINEIIRTLNDIAERRRSPEGHYDLQH